MNAFLAVLCLAVTASASHIGIGVGHHIPSGSVGVSAHGAVIAGPAGSIHTDNGIDGHGAGARLSGPAGDVRTHGGLAQLSGPGIGHHGHGGIGVGLGGGIGGGIGLGGGIGGGIGLGGGIGGGIGLGHGVAVVAPVVQHVVPVAIAHGHHGISHGLIGHGVAHGLVGHGAAHGLVGHGAAHGLVGIGAAHGLVGHHGGW